MSNRHAGGTGGANDYIARLNAMDDEIGARRNLLHNGAFQIWQRGTTFATGAARIYTADRWVAYRTSLVAGMTVSQQAGGNAKWCARVQRDAANAALNVLNFVQQVEDLDIVPLRGQYVTLKFRARCGANYSSAGAILNAAVNTGTGVNEQNDFAYTGLIATPQAFQLTTSFQVFQTLPLLLPSNINEAALQFNFTPTGTAGAADYFEVEEAQLVPSQFPGTFPYRDPQVEQETCERFARLVAGIGSASATTAVDLGVVLDQPMRATPVISAPAVVSVWDATGSATVTQSAAAAVWQAGSSARGGIARLANFTGLTLGRQYSQLSTTPLLLSADL